MKLSIVVPMYNLERYITPLLESLLRQSDQRFEVVLVDDGSADRTGEVVQEFMAQHPALRGRLIRTANGGVSAARNTGLSAAEGDYVLFLDGDDYASERLTESIITHTLGTEPDIFCWGYNLVREDGSTIVSFAPEGGDGSGSDALADIFVHRRLRIWTGSIAFRRSFLLTHGIRYTERCVNGEDQEFIYKALSQASRVIAVPEVLSFYVQRTSSITGTYNVAKFDVAAAFKRTAEYFRAHPFAGMDTISQLLLGRELTENYFYNLKTCLNGASTGRIQDLLQDIDQAYPGLNQEMRGIMKDYAGEDRQLAVQIKAFLLSPVLYQRLIKLDHGWIQSKQRLKSVIARKELKI
ncbi:glycosyltransferase family 2 protein [Paenibacillus tengchongensis]|uniref:glycosyltransferase family 2 protein n=1 Tax=Paenibacillus tengchongensis TaxID=2608684 RepID=UPI00124DB7A0|nr:glycosyltransferase [Paenibacillus tengchongensis]